MNSIGIRVAPKFITFAIFNQEQNKVLNVEEIICPSSFEEPLKLKYIRTNLLDILDEFKVTTAGIREIELTSKNISLLRIRIEGVVLETFASSDLEFYFSGQIDIVSMYLKIERSNFKPMVAGQNFLNVDNWQAHTVEQREAILCAIGASNAYTL